MDPHPRRLENTATVRNRAPSPHRPTTVWAARLLRWQGLRRGRLDVCPSDCLWFLSDPRHELGDCSTDSWEIRPQVHQDGARHALMLPDQTEEQVLGADVIVMELQCLTKRELEDLFGPGCERRRAGRRVGGHPDRLFHLFPHGVEGDPQGLERPGADSVTLADEPQENVLGADEAVVEQARFLLRPHQDLPCPVREPFEHLKMVPVRSLGLSANFSPGSLHRSSAL